MSFLQKPLLYASIVGTAVGSIYLIKEYSGGPHYEGKEKLTGKVIIVTGSNTGIGKAVVHDLAKRDAKVIMACRDMFKCEMARKDIVLETKNKYVYCRLCDLSSQESIREFVDEFKKEHNRLDILINNAAIMRCPKSYTKEGIEMQLGVNHMGHFLLTNLLLDYLKASAPSRIINVSSVIYQKAKLYTLDLNGEHNYDPSSAYAQSKLANVLFTQQLEEKLRGTKVTVNVVYPGIVDTELTRHMSYYNSNLSSFILKPFIWPFIKTPRHGAQTILYAALDPSLENVSGVLLRDCKIGDINGENGINKTWAQWLWLTSEKWTGLG